MNIKPKIILLFILISSSLLLISLIYNSINHYNQNKEVVIKEIQTTFDNSVEYYYNEIAKNNFIAIVSNDSLDFKKVIKNKTIDSIFKPKQSASNLKKVQITSVKFEESNVNIVKGKRRVDSISNIRELTHKIVMSFQVDTIDFKAFKEYFNKKLNQKNIKIEYQLQLKNNKKINQKTPILKNKKNIITLKNNSSFLPQNGVLYLKFNLPNNIILKKGIYNLAFSVSLMLMIVLLLIYMLWIIQNQKKIDEIKNDFISNITHELKTPIATIHAAIDGIKHFNEANDQEKTKKYLDIAQNQNEKLNIIVEKILETASIDVNHLKLNLETTNLSHLLNDIFIDFKQNISYKSFEKEIKNDISAKIDVFHFQNVITNILDNAVKYGGNEIKIQLSKTQTQIFISINDNGMIENKEKDLIFNKFYRINQGNLHNTKGFGIGLYYAEKIIGLHQGKLTLKNTKFTTFEIILTNDET